MSSLTSKETRSPGAELTAAGDGGGLDHVGRTLHRPKGQAGGQRR